MQMKATNRRISFFAATTALCLAAVSAAAQDAASAKTSASGTLMLGDATYKVSQAVAYEAKRGGEPFTVLLASDRAIPWAKIQAALKENNGSDENLMLDQPHLRLVFEKSGKVRSYSATNGQTSVSRFGDEVKARCNCEQERTAGEARTASDPDSSVKWAFDIRWDVNVGAQAAAVPSAAPAGPAKPLVTGDFLGNSKPAKLAFVSAQPGEPFDGKPVTVIVFTEKDHSRDPKPAMNAGFGRYGSALIISVFPDGKIIGCEVAHASNKMPFSSVGAIHTSNFESGNGRMSGEITTDGEQKFFDQTWNVNLKFVAPCATASGESEKPAATTVTTQPTRRAARTLRKTDNNSGSATANAAPKLNVKDLALPEGAKDIVYKKLVQHMSFRSDAAVQLLAQEISNRLAAQGWVSDKGHDLVTAKSAILDRNRAGAKLTIFVKKDGQGSKVSLMTEGLDWSGKE
jgi:hypothetical protein